MSRLIYEAFPLLYIVPGTTMHLCHQLVCKDAHAGPVCVIGRVISKFDVSLNTQDKRVNYFLCHGDLKKKG